MSSDPTVAGGATTPVRRGLRILFLDDDPGRAEIFLEGNPEAVWVQTVAECLARLPEPWDEVHLDHDLGGERYVDLGREDCGMEVVRWLCLEPRPHLRGTRFFIHSHNIAAASLMTLQMQGAGFWVELRPFGEPAADLPEPEAAPRRGLLARLRALLRRGNH